MDILELISIDLVFGRLIGDIEQGKINLVITKDLSRLGRDYIEVGRYLEKYFPENQVRYIAVNDNIDTFDYSNTNNDMTPFRAVFNDMYAKDISKKVRTSIITKATTGECIKAFQPYGYKKDANNKNNILIDENVADNVRKIFELYKAGYSRIERHFLDRIYGFVRTPKAACTFQIAVKMNICKQFICCLFFIYSCHIRVSEAVIHKAWCMLLSFLSGAYINTFLHKRIFKFSSVRKSDIVKVKLTVF